MGVGGSDRKYLRFVYRLHKTKQYHELHRAEVRCFIHRRFTQNEKYFQERCVALLALVMYFPPWSIGSTTAFAAGEEAETFLVSFPRDGDSNYSNSWGHGSLTYRNGWYADSSRYTTVYAMNSYTGNICYCIEPGVPLETGDSLTARDEYFWDNYPGDFNNTITPYEIKMFIGRIFQYGYTGTISTSWRSQNAGDADTLAEAMATQILVWETVVGERNEAFENIGSGGYDAVLDSISTDHPLYSQVIDHYGRIRKAFRSTVCCLIFAAPPRQGG
ncbi:MAG: thioester domain-containing protein [Eisenbergiella massiliensis]